MSWRNARIVWAWILPVTVLLAGCSGSTNGKDSAPSADKSAAKKLTIAVIPKGTLHDFWKSIHAGAVKAERELAGVEVIWKGPAREDDREGQIQLVENFVNRGVDAIVLAPSDRTALVGPVELAKKKGIPVIIIDSALDSEDIDSFVATDNYQGGALAAKHMGKVLGGKGNIVCLRYQTGSASTEMREAGFLDTIKKEFPNIVILSDNLQSGALRDGAQAKAENLLTRFEGKIDGWFCPCEPVTFGCLRAIQSKGFAGKIKLIGFDAGQEIVTSLKQGEIEALVLQDPMNMGYLGVKLAVEAKRGKAPAKRISTGENLLTRENMDTPAMKNLHSPDLTPWLGSASP